MNNTDGTKAEQHKERNDTNLNEQFMLTIPFY